MLSTIREATGLSQEEFDQEFGIVEFFSGLTHEHETFHAYIIVRPSIYAQYKVTANEGAPIDLTAYGRVLHAGTGQLPDAETQARLKNEFGIDHDLENFMSSKITIDQGTKR